MNVFLVKAVVYHLSQRIFRFRLYYNVTVHCSHLRKKKQQRRFVFMFPSSVHCYMKCWVVRNIALHMNFSSGFGSRNNFSYFAFFCLLFRKNSTLQRKTIRLFFLCNQVDCKTFFFLLLLQN